MMGGRRFGWLAVLCLVMVHAAPLKADDSVWMAQVQAKLEAHKTYPRSAAIRGAGGRVGMEVAVDGFGMITGYQLVEKSEFDILNAEADRILFKIGQFPPPPDGQPRRFVLNIDWPTP